MRTSNLALRRTYVNVQAESGLVRRFFDRTEGLTDQERADLVGASPGSVRRWKALAEGGKAEAIPMLRSSHRLMLGHLDGLPPADVEAYGQGVRTALRRARAALDELERELVSEEASHPAAPAPGMTDAQHTDGEEGGGEERLPA